MNITGIITEYNPFHNGHKYHLREAVSTTKCDGVVCIMSGNFVQRGGPALIDKWNRTRMALENGVDLIIELPTFYAISSAEYFARGSVSILNSLGVVNNLFFGSECGSIDTLNKIAQILVNEPFEFSQLLKEYLDDGVPFYKAREKALIEFTNNESIKDTISSSNNILGIEYLKAIIELKSKIKPYTLKRQGSNYNDKNITNSFSSATSIREAIKNKSSLISLNNTLPDKSTNIMMELESLGYPFIFDDDMYRYIRYKISTNCVNFNNLYEVSEGLDKKIIKEVLDSIGYEDFILRIKSKRYAYSKISRILTQIFIGLDNCNLKSLDNPDYHFVRVLGFNNKGREILSKIKKDTLIPIVTKVPKHPNNPLLELDLLATKAYSILNPLIDPRADYLTHPIIIK